MEKTFLHIILLFSSSILMLKSKRQEECGDELSAWVYFLSGVVFFYVSIFFLIFI